MGSGEPVGSTGVPLIGNTIVRNLADKGGGIYLATRKTPGGPVAAMRNCIVTDARRGGGVQMEPDVRMYLWYTDVFANAGGDYVGLPNQTGLNGNLSVNPRYADLAGGDYHLKSQAGRWVPGSGTWVKDDETSLCIDAGDPASPFDREPPPNGGRVNMGADGNTEEASKSFTGMMLGHVPASGQTNMSTKTAVMITFRWTVQEGSVEQRFPLTPAGGSPVPGRFAWGRANRAVTFIPTKPLQGLTPYTVTLAKNVQRLDGTVLDWSESFSFTTGASAFGALAVTATAGQTASGGAAITVDLSSAANVAVTVLNVGGASWPNCRVRSAIGPQHSALGWSVSSGHSGAARSLPDADHGPRRRRPAEPGAGGRQPGTLTALEPAARAAMGGCSGRNPARAARSTKWS